MAPISNGSNVIVANLIFWLANQNGTGPIKNMSWAVVVAQR